jgi:hypothetical protein
MERAFRNSAIAALVLLSLPLPTLAGMYKWYDEQGKVNYSQTPPPKGSRMAPINTDTFNVVEMSPVPKMTPRPRTRATQPASQPQRAIAPKRTTRSTCPLRRSR